VLLYSKEEPVPRDPESVVRRLIEEGFNKGRLEVADEVSSPDLLEHQDFGPDHAPGSEGVKAVITSLRRAFSDFHLSIEDLAVDGEKVWFRLVGSGTNDGSFMGHPPTGRRMRTDVFDLVRVVDGRIVEHWGVPDRLSVLFQLGLACPPASAAPDEPAAAGGR
jgi:predicted ester cyclase